MTIEEFDCVVKRNIGENCFVVSICIDDDSFAIVSDGEYDYKIKIGKCTNTKLRGIRNMTNESRLKRINLFCTNNVIAVDFFEYKKNLTVMLVHVPTGHSEQRAASINQMSKFCETIEKNALKNVVFIEKSKTKFGTNLSYDKTKYVDSRINVTVTCSVHGDFDITPNRFEQSIHGCPECGKEARFGFSKTSFTNACKDGVGYIYCILCYDEVENFIKIGITSNKDLKYRFGKSAIFPYQYKMLAIEKSHPDIIFFIENLLHRKYRHLKHKPTKEFHGDSECFKLWVYHISNDCCRLIKKLVKDLPESKKFAYLKTTSD
ncbi:MAG: GIY-YIG nuclease family protein [Candidatus Doudnabacteria bacterium]